MIGGDKKSSARQGSPTNTVDDASHKTTKELHVSEGVDVPANDVIGVELDAFFHLK